MTLKTLPVNGTITLNASAATVVGETPLGDGSDATYIQNLSWSTQDHNVGIPALTGYEVGDPISLRLRASVTNAGSIDYPGDGVEMFLFVQDGNPTDLSGDHYVAQFTPGAWNSYKVFDLATDGSIDEVVLPLRTAPGKTVADVVAVLESGSALLVFNLFDNNESSEASTNRVYAATIEVGTTPAVSTPTPTVTEVGTDSITITWDEIPDAINYEVRVNGGTPTLLGVVTEHTLTGLVQMTSYTIEVRANTVDAASAWGLVTQRTEAIPVRPHYHRSLRNAAGDLRTGATISLLIPGTEEPLPQTVYAAATGTSTRGTTWVATTGIVDFYLDDPAVVDIKVTPTGGEPPKTFASQWVGDAENLTHEGLTTAGAAAGQVPIADSEGGWSWGSPGTTGPAVTSVNDKTGDVVLTPADVGAVPAGQVVAVVVLTQSEYDALPEDAPGTLYVIDPVA